MTTISRNEWSSLEEAQEAQRRFPFCAVCSRTLALVPFGDVFYLVCMSHIDGTSQRSLTRFQPYLFDVFGATRAKDGRLISAPPYHHGIRDKVIQEKPRAKAGEAPKAGQRWYH